MKPPPVMKPPSLPPPPLALPTTEGKSKTKGATSIPSEQPDSDLDGGGGDSNSTNDIALGLGETIGSRRPREKVSLLAAVPREVRQYERLPCEGRVDTNNRRGSVASQEPVMEVRSSQGKPSVQVVSSSRRRRDTSTIPGPISVTRRERTTQRQFDEEEEEDCEEEDGGDVGEEEDDEEAEEAVFDGQPGSGHRKPSSLSSSRAGSEGVEPAALERGAANQERDQSFRRLQDARRGRDMVARSKMATAVAAANAAAAAAKSITAAIAAVGFSHTSSTSHMPTNEQRRGVAATAGRHALSRASATPVVRKPAGNSSRTTKAGHRRGIHTSSFPSFRRQASTAARGSKISSISTTAAMVEGGGGGAGEKGLATEALIERFSCRERELLRELETWKSKCQSLSIANDSAIQNGASTGGGACASGYDHDGGSDSATRDAFALCGHSGRSVSQNVTRLEVASAENGTAASRAVRDKVQRQVQTTAVSGLGTTRGGAEIPDANQVHVEPSPVDTRHLVGGGARSVSVSHGLALERDSNDNAQRLASLEVRVGYDHAAIVFE